MTELAPDGRQLVFSTYLGGGSEDWGLGIGLDATGYIYVDGQTTSIDFPLVRPLQDHYAGDNIGMVTDSFIARLAPEGQGVIYSTYFGSVSWDNLQDLAVDQGGNVYITGEVDAPSPDFPLVGPAFQTANKGIRNAFVAKFSDNYSGPPQPFPTATPRPAEAVAEYEALVSEYAHNPRTAPAPIDLSRCPGITFLGDAQVVIEECYRMHQPGSLEQGYVGSRPSHTLRDITYVAYVHVHSHLALDGMLFLLVSSDGCAHGPYHA